MISSRGLLLFILAYLLAYAGATHGADGRSTARHCELEGAVASFAAKYLRRGDHLDDVETNLAESLELFGARMPRARVRAAVMVAKRHPQKSRRQVELLARRACLTHYHHHKEKP